MDKFNKWGFFPITVQGAVAICKRERINFHDIHNNAPQGTSAVDHCLSTGAKISWNRDYGYVIYGYRHDRGDTLPYRHYVNARDFGITFNGVWYRK